MELLFKFYAKILFFLFAMILNLICLDFGLMRDKTGHLITSTWNWILHFQFMSNVWNLMHKTINWGIKLVVAPPPNPPKMQQILQSEKLETGIFWLLCLKNDSMMNKFRINCPAWLID